MTALTPFITLLAPYFVAHVVYSSATGYHPDWELRAELPAFIAALATLILVAYALAPFSPPPPVILPPLRPWAPPIPFL